jgi:hypothetical protein
MTPSYRQKRNPTIDDFHFPIGLPTAEDLPCSDDTPVDNEIQTLLPTLLYTILADLWRDQERNWLFSIDMGLYYSPDQPAISPDGMLTLGIAPAPSENLRSSYVLWEEKVLPLFVLEIISKTPGQERTRKRDIYESIGILYYLVYAPLAKPQKSFQLYKLVAGEYILQNTGSANAVIPHWMPEIGLGIGAERRTVDGIEREWLFWYNEFGERHLTPGDRADIADQKANLEAQRANLEAQRADQEAQARRLAEQTTAALRQRLRELGINPDIEI